MTAPEILATGGLIVDSAVAADGTVSLERMGGNAAYAAVGARIWSPRVAVSGNVAAGYPAGWIDELAAAGIGTDGVVRRPDEADEAEWFVHAPDGSRVDHVHAPARVFLAAGFDPHRLTPGERDRWLDLLRTRRPERMTFGAFRARWPVTVEQAVRGAPAPRGVHLAPERPDAQAALADAFRARGAVVSLDPGFAAARLSGPDLDALLARIDAFLPSEKELAQIAPGLDPAAALAVLARRTGALLVAKLGAAGALVLDRARGRLVRLGVVPVRAIDPTGAGDAFCGGFVAGLVATGDPVTAAVRGTVSASFAVEGFGALHALGADPAEAARRADHVLSTLREEPLP
jgi:sugar/nucleoside kinase (ribokinase family)